MSHVCVSLNDLSAVIGSTPMVKLTVEYRGNTFPIYAKAEQFNLTGSIKDRMAYYVLKKALEEGRIKPGMQLAEATSGNTGISFSAIGSALGLKVRIFMPDWMSEERKALIRSYGADIELVSKEDGGFLGSIDRSQKHAESCDCFLPQQFENRYNAEAHEVSTAPEIEAQLKEIGLTIDAFVAGVGTGGTIMGVRNYFAKHRPDAKMYPLEPSNSPTLTTGHKVGSHRIQGVSDEFIPELLSLDDLDDVIMVDDGDAILMAQKLARIGLGVGISSGANILGAILALDKIGFDKTVVTVLADDSKKYLSTDLMREEPVKDDFLTPDVKILRYETMPCPALNTDFTC